MINYQKKTSDAIIKELKGIKKHLESQEREYIEYETIHIDSRNLSAEELAFIRKLDYTSDIRQAKL